jgi:aspartyl-tRNA(Asn)/glutamyl-tRNA(Gln) amidotransferase subunit A
LNTFLQPKSFSIYCLNNMLCWWRVSVQVRTLVQREMSEALQKYDVLVCPAAPTAAYKLGEKLSDPLAMYKGDLMTINLNLAGLPAVVVPCGYTVADDSAAAAGSQQQQLPVGLQLVGPMFGEQQLLKVAHIYEQTAGVAGKAQPQVAAAPVHEQLVAA